MENSNRIFLIVLCLGQCFANMYISLLFFLDQVSFSKNKIIYIFNLFIYLWLCWVFVAVRGLSLVAGSGLLFVVVHGLLIAVASLVAEHGLQACGLWQLWHTGSVVVARGLQSAGSMVAAHGLSCSAACGIFPDQGSNPCPLHWQVDS